MQNTEQINPSDVRILRKQLQRGDIDAIATGSGVSTETVRLAFKADSMTDTYRKVLVYAADLVKKRREKEARAAEKIQSVIPD